MTTSPENTADNGDNNFPPENDSDESTVNTDDEEFSDFISSKWKDSVEVGLSIQYPLPYTNYLAQSSNEIGEDNEEETKIEGKTILVDSDETVQREDRPTLPTLSLSTVLQEGSIAPLFDGTQWAGTRVWKAAVVGLEYILRQMGQDNLGALLELGCGLGVPGMVWKQVLSMQGPGSPRVVLTDRDSLITQLQANVEANFPGDSSIEAMPLDWSAEGITSLLRDETETHGTIFDVCLNCDCVYEPLYGREAWESLVDVLSEVAQTSPSTLLVTALERRNGDNVEGFLAKLEASGTVETPIRRVVRHDEDPHHVIEIYVTKGSIQSS
eukprot:CAMPEP_0116123158 /NCGR_PEP_ID=MMETSP0329-20121206/4599_1 /TAXON_ID=697910 /ORGANISM="Pseudo-nitzschia arenysensis, Strain B593" /LENGTH=325 /DNA_ID=CAMNT_0003617055 /DNA_START=91 /DNA_END=1068 /DNA_ORIENTATION=-